MKYRSLWIVLLALLLSAASVYAQAGLDVLTTAEVRLRSGPGTEWRIVSILPVGTAVRLDGKAIGDFWVRGITSGGDVGWMSYQALSITPEQFAALPTIFVDTPFSLSAPGGAARPEQPAAPESSGEPEAAAPTAVPEAPAPPVVNSAPVRGFQYGGHIHSLSDATVNALNRAGMTWIKVQITRQGDYRGIINAAHARGFRILLGMVGFAGQVGDDAYLDQFAAYVAGAAAAGADAIEVWNEPNIDREWPSGQISPARYTELLRRAYNAIKAANPNTLVISGAPAPTGFFGGCSPAGCDDNAFVAGMAAAGAANYLDCVGIHYNEGILPPSARSGDPRGNSSHYSRYFGAMIDTYTRAFGSSRPLCFTELGYLSPEGYGPLPGAFGWAENVTAAQQAQWLDQAVTMAANSGRVRLLIVWNVDFTEYGADPMAGYAIIRPGGACYACDLLGN